MELTTFQKPAIDIDIDIDIEILLPDIEAPLRYCRVISHDLTHAGVVGSRCSWSLIFQRSYHEQHAHSVFIYHLVT